MSKLYENFLKLKKSDNNYFYLFKSGMFYIFIDSDATFVANELHLKLTNLNNSILKCGFPCNSLNKYKEFKCMYISRIYNILKNDEYVIGPYNIFTIYEPKKEEL